MIHVSLLLHSPDEGLKVVTCHMPACPRNSERIWHDSRTYAVTDVTYLVGELPLLVGSEKAAEAARAASPVEVEVTAWKR